MNHIAQLGRLVAQQQMQKQAFRSVAEDAPTPTADLPDSGAHALNRMDKARKQYFKNKIPATTALKRVGKAVTGYMGNESPRAKSIRRGEYQARPGTPAEPRWRFESAGPGRIGNPVERINSDFPPNPVNQHFTSRDAKRHGAYIGLPLWEKYRENGKSWELDDVLEGLGLWSPGNADN